MQGAPHRDRPEGQGRTQSEAPWSNTCHDCPFMLLLAAGQRGVVCPPQIHPSDPRAHSGRLLSSLLVSGQPDLMWRRCCGCCGLWLGQEAEDDAADNARNARVGRRQQSRHTTVALRARQQVDRDHGSGGGTHHETQVLPTLRSEKLEVLGRWRHGRLTRACPGRGVELVGCRVGPGGRD